MIKQDFLYIARTFTSEEQGLSMWTEIEKKYTSSSRHYHTLHHLDKFIQELLPYQDRFANWHTIVFAIAYHDIIYNTLKSNNEEKSAAYAKSRLFKTSFPEKEITHCTELILATKNHEAIDFETNLFTDADLSILGSEPEIYRQYAKQIRREYSYYPDMMYNPGRKKILNHFLNGDHIFKTDEFKARYEAQARVNLQWELESFTM